MPEPRGIIEAAYENAIRDLDEEILVRAALTFTLRKQIDDLLPMVEPEDFANTARQEVWRLCRQLRDRNSYITPDNIRGEWAKGSEIPEILIRETINKAAGNPVNYGEAKRAAELVKDVARRRQLLNVLYRATERLRLGGEQGTYQHVLDGVYERLDKLGTDTSSLDGQSLSEAVEDWWEELLNPSERTVIPTPWWEVNEFLASGGMHGGQLVVFGARPGVGKTVALANVAQNAAESGHPTLFISQEMNKHEIMSRIVSDGANVMHTHIVDNNLNDDEKQRIAQWQEEHQADPLTIVSQPGVTLADVRALVKSMQRTHGLKVVVIDYLQIMGTTGRSDTRAIEVGKLSYGLKMLALETDVLIVTAAQLSRPQREDDGKKPPQLHHLRESGNIEQDANTVILLHRDPTDRDITKITLKIAKNRSGRCATVDEHWDGARSRIGIPRSDTRLTGRR